MVKRKVHQVMIKICSYYLSSFQVTEKEIAQILEKNEVIL
jgi:hypothetical protein